jgi:hypothetical protein
MKGSGFAVLLILTAALPLPALGSSDRDQDLYEKAETGATVEVTGLVRLVGSEPFPELVITGRDDHDWYIAREESAALRKYERRTITVRGIATRQEMVLANGKRLEDRLVLSKVKVVSQ